MELADLHIHSSLSDGSYDPSFLVERLTECIDAGEITKFGFSDHYDPNGKMWIKSPEELRKYVKRLMDLRYSNLEYKKLRENEFLIGFEVNCRDGVPEIPDDIRSYANYMLLENAEDRIDEVVSKNRPYWQIHQGLAHPNYDKLKSEEVLEKLVAENVFLELNASRETHLHYPSFFSWLPARFRKELKFSFGSDLHHGLFAVARIRGLANFARTHHLHIIKIEDNESK